MAENKQILLVGKDGKGGIINHPAHFGYPPKKKVSEKWFINTGRFRTINSERTAVFIEEGFKLNLDDFADAKEEEPEVAPDTQALDELDEVVDGIVGVYGKDSAEYQSALSEIAEWHNQHLNERVTQSWKKPRHLA